MGGLPSQGSGGPPIPGDKHRTHRVKIRYNDKTIDPLQEGSFAFSHRYCDSWRNLFFLFVLAMLIY
jgi:hypothetical protein